MLTPEVQKTVLAERERCAGIADIRRVL